MRRTPLFLSLIVTLSLAATGPAEAKNRDKAWEFGLAVAHIDGDSVVPLSNDFPAFTLTAGYMMSAKLEAEFFLSTSSTDYGAPPGDLTTLATSRVSQSRCRGNLTSSDIDPACYTGDPLKVTPNFSGGDDVMRAFVQITGNYFTDRETRTIPYFSGGAGIITETREAFPYSAIFTSTAPDETVCPDGSQGPDGDLLRETCSITQTGIKSESYDASFLLTLGTGARTFLNEWFGIRYEARYIRHDSFKQAQDEWVVTAGATFVVGGQK